MIISTGSSSVEFQNWDRGLVYPPYLWAPVLATVLIGHSLPNLSLLPRKRGKWRLRLLLSVHAQ